MSKSWIPLEELGNQQRIPLIGNFEVTRKCQLDCKVCYNARENKPELSLNQIKRIIDELAEMGCLHINYTGGEAFIRKDFEEIYRYTIELGIRPSIETNACYLSDQHIKMLKEFPPEIMHVSLYSLDNNQYNETTNTQDMMEHALSNINRLLNNSIMFTIRTPVSKYNYLSVPDLFEYASNIERDFIYNTKIFWKQSGERCVEHRCRSRMVKQLRDDHELYYQLYKRLVTQENDMIKRRDCMTGIYDFNINPYGELHYCIVFWKPIYNLLEGSFKDAWDNWYPQYRRLEDNYCIGKRILPTDGYCPFGYFFMNEEADCSISLDKRISDEYNRMKIEGMSEEDIAIYFDTTIENIIQIVSDNK